MEIINVIELNMGIMELPKSFPIPFDSERKKIVKEAEDLFVKLIKEHDTDEELDDDDLNDLTDEGHYSNHLGYEVYLTWSEIVTYM